MPILESIQRFFDIFFKKGGEKKAVRPYRSTVKPKTSAKAVPKRSVRGKATATPVRKAVKRAGRSAPASSRATAPRAQKAVKRTATAGAGKGTAAKKTVTKKAPAKKAVKKPAPKKAPAARPVAKKAPVKKTPTTRRPAPKKPASRSGSGARKSVGVKKAVAPKSVKEAAESKGKLIGEVTHYFAKIKVVVVKITAGHLHLEDKIMVKGSATLYTQTVSSLQIESSDVKSAKKGQLVGMQVSKPTRVGDKIYKLAS